MTKISKCLILLLIAVFSASMIFLGVSCKEESAEKVEEVEEESAEKVEEVEEVIKEEKPYAGETITIAATMVSDPNWDKVVKVLEDETGIKINSYELPSAYADTVTKLTTVLSSGDDSWDIVYIGEFCAVGFPRAGWIDPISDVMTPEVVKAYPSDVIEKISSYNGEIYTVPSDLSPMFLYVNKKMFADAGIEYPTTEDEFIEAAKVLTNEEEGVYGYGAAWSRTGELYNDAIRWTYNYGGDYYDWTKPGAKEAFHRMYDYIYTDKITPAAVLADNYMAANNKFLEGKYGMYMMWASLLAGIGDRYGQDFEIAPYPTFDTNHTLVAGWHWTLSSFSKKKDAAKEVLKVLASDAGQRTMIYVRSKTCASSNVLNEPDIVKDAPWLKSLAEYIEAGSLKPRPSCENVTQVQEQTEIPIHEYISKQISLEECIEQGQAVLDKLVE